MNSNFVYVLDFQWQQIGFALYFHPSHWTHLSHPEGSLPASCPVQVTVVDIQNLHVNGFHMLVLFNCMLLFFFKFQMYVCTHACVYIYYLFIYLFLFCCRFTIFLWNPFIIRTSCRRCSPHCQLFDTSCCEKRLPWCMDIQYVAIPAHAFILELSSDEFF